MPLRTSRRSLSTGVRVLLRKRPDANQPVTEHCFELREGGCGPVAAVCAAASSERTRSSFLPDSTSACLGGGRRSPEAARASRAAQHQELPTSRHLPKGSPLPKAPFAAGVAVMGGMFYTVIRDAKHQPGTLDTQTAQQGGATTLSVDADTSSSVLSSTVPAKAQPKTAAQFLGGYEEVCQPPGAEAHTQHVHRAGTLHVHGVHPARYRRRTCHRMCSLRPT